MDAGYFIIAILGCADGGSQCTPVATLPIRYESAERCSAATGAALADNNNFDFPTLLARCKAAPAEAAERTRSANPRRG